MVCFLGGDNLLFGEIFEGGNFLPVCLGLRFNIELAGVASRLFLLSANK